MTIVNQHGDAQITVHSEIILDPFRGRDGEHDRILATTRRAAFKTLPYMFDWCVRNLEDRFDKEITVTFVAGAMVLSIPLYRGFFSQLAEEDESKRKTREALIKEIVDGVTQTFAMLIGGDLKVQAPSPIQTATAGQTKKLVEGNFGRRGEQ